MVPPRVTDPSAKISRLAEFRTPLMGTRPSPGVNTNTRRLLASVTYRFAPSHAKAVGVGVISAADWRNRGWKRSVVLETTLASSSGCPRITSAAAELDVGMELKIS